MTCPGAASCALAGGCRCAARAGQGGIGGAQITPYGWRVGSAPSRWSLRSRSGRGQAQSRGMPTGSLPPPGLDSSSAKRPAPRQSLRSRAPPYGGSAAASGAPRDRLSLADIPLAPLIARRGADEARNRVGGASPRWCRSLLGRSAPAFDMAPASSLRRCVCRLGCTGVANMLSPAGARSGGDAVLLSEACPRPPLPRRGNVPGRSRLPIRTPETP